MSGAWDQTRASFAQERISSALAVANEILFADLLLPAQADRHYIIESVVLVGRCVTRRPLDPPLSGLFLVGSDTNPVGAPWAANQRGMPIPLSACYCCDVPLGSNFAIAYVSQAGFKITVPRGFTIRGIVQCDDVLATAGPGVGSTLLLRALVVEEPDCR